MYVRANNDIICVDKLIKAEYKPGSYNSSTIILTYTVDNVNTKESIVVSEFSNISKNCIQLLTEALKNNKNFVDLSKNS